MKRELLLEVLADALCGNLHPGDSRLAGVVLELEPVAGRVRVVRGAGANVGVLCTPEGCMLVDDSFAPLLPRICDLLGPPAPGGWIRFVVNTHWHLDHTGGNAALGTKVTVIAHAATRRRLAAFHAGLTGPAARRGEPALPVLTFEDALTLRVGGEEVRLLHLGPGHTDGDVAVHFVESNVVQLGDLFVTYGLPYVDARSGGSAGGVARFLRQLCSHLPADVKVIPGHGPVCGRSEVLQFVAVLEDCLERVRAALRRGWELEDMLARKVLGPHARLSSPFVTERGFLTVLRDEIAAERSG